MPEVSWLGVTVAALASFAIGAIWYSPLLFTKVWQREAGVTDEKGKTMNMPALGVNYLFEQRSLKLWLINGGYNVAVFTAFGAILGVL